MIPIQPSPLENHDSVAWSLTSFAIHGDFNSKPETHAVLLLDRANSEFGLVYQLGPGIAVMAQFPDNDDPIYFQVSRICAASSRLNHTNKKVCVLMQNFQIDLEFTAPEHAQDFLQTLGRLATKVGNLYFEVYEVPGNVAFTKSDFSMQKMGYTSTALQSWIAVPDPGAPEWARIYKTGKCTDFTIFADCKQFSVHRVLLSTRSQYFNAVCDGYFTETEQRCITLPESAQTVATMLEEMYEVYNSTTGSIFTNFALLREIEKEQRMSHLLDLFVACDKYNLEKIKQKVADTIIDRLPFVSDVLSIVDLASQIHECCPQLDRGLRKAIVTQIVARFEAIRNDHGAWEEFSGNQTLMLAVCTHRWDSRETASSTVLSTPAVTPEKANKPSRMMLRR